MSTSCVQIDPKDFHGPKADAYTERCLEQLAASKQFRSYLDHLEYKERLQLTWFLIPLGLVSVVYYHLSFFNSDFLVPSSVITSARLEESAAHASGLALVTVFVIFYLFPCTVVAPFAGFFEDPSRCDSLRVYFFLTLVNALLVSYGGPALDHRPFLQADPPIPWAGLVVRRTVDPAGPTDLGTALRVLLVRLLPMQGFVMAGYAVSHWQRAFWRRMWHIPFPLLSVPVLVGAGGVLWWYLSSLIIPYAVAANGKATSAGMYSWKTLRKDPASVAHLWSSILSEVARRVEKEAREWVAGGIALPGPLADPARCVHVYVSGVSVALAYFLTLAVRPIIEFVFGGFCLLLPVDPTIWGLTLLTSVGALVALLRMEELMLPYVAAAGTLAFLLLYNGFVA